MPISVVPSPFQSPVTGMAPLIPKAIGRSMPGDSVSIVQVPPASRSLRHWVPSTNRTGRQASPSIFVLRLETRGNPASMTERCHEYTPPAPPKYSGGGAGGIKSSGGGGGGAEKNSGGSGGGGGGSFGGSGGMMNVVTCTSLKL